MLAVLILGLLWLFQTILLQSSYERMVKRNVQRIASSLVEHANQDDFESWLNTTAADNSLLIFVTDEQGQILYATDEHSNVYAVQVSDTSDGNGNPYRQNQEQSWQRGQAHYLSLPSGYEDFLMRLRSSADGTVAYTSGTAFIYGFRMTVNGTEAVTYISTTLAAVGSTVKIIRIQLLWVTVISLAMAFGMAWVLARRFSAPVSRISDEARRLAEGQFDATGTKGFSTELDALSDSLTQAARDITEARKYQRDFLANISHDLRTPLTMIKGYAEMVRDISWRDEEKREKDLDVIIREVDRLTALVNDIIDYSGMESGRSEISMACFDISRMAEEVAGRFIPLCEQEGYMFNRHITPELKAIGDEAQLARVVYNLLDNAITHAGADKTVLLTVCENNNHIRVEMEDHGEGIPEDVLPYVWDRYFKTAQSRRNKKGSGLGLAISREIVQRHQGTYGVNSSGNGSVFWFEIPVANV
ncbi:MAG: HAMP domain-containing histidine kinase [Clostridia bacterium]|nr:HAMP domain-containing histidine kinase [Clostridia bacterium]